MPNNSHIITQTKKWLTSFIIEHNICPFAKREYDNNTIAYHVCTDQKMEDLLHHVIDRCRELDTDETIETALLICPQGLKSFDNYLDFLSLANALMLKQGYEGVYQLASFHPDYCFDGVEPDDASNYSNRSPYPMLHFIREASLEKVLAHYPNPEEIPQRNIQYLREMGQEHANNILLNCLK